MPDQFETKCSHKTLRRKGKVEKRNWLNFLSLTKFSHMISIREVAEVRAARSFDASEPVLKGSV